MTRRVLLGIRLAVLLLALTPAAGCGGSANYVLKVDSPVAPFKPADPEDLVVEDETEDEDADEASAGDAGEE